MIAAQAGSDKLILRKTLPKVVAYEDP
jgi:hypothetical protein